MAEMESNSREIFDTIQNERNGIAEIHSAFASFPTGVAAHYQFYKQIILAESLPLERAEREYLALKTSESNECPYCIGHHKKAFENTGASDIDSEKKIVLENLALVLSQNMWKASSLKGNFLKAGYTEAQWSHAIMVVAYFNFANRCAHAMGLEIEEDFEATCG